jgi:hypothetical protein
LPFDLYKLASYLPDQLEMASREYTEDDIADAILVITDNGISQYQAAVTVGGHRRYRRSYNSLFSIILTEIRVTLLTERSSKSYIFSSGENSENIISLRVYIGPPGPFTAGARGLSASCP